MWGSMGRWYYPRWCLHLMSITHETPFCSIIQLNFTVFARGSETNHCPVACLRITVLLAILGFEIGQGKSATGSDICCFLNHLTEVIKPRIFVSSVITWWFEVLACWHGSRSSGFAAVFISFVSCPDGHPYVVCAARLTTYVCYTMFVFAAAVAAVVIVVVGVYSVLESRTLILSPGIQDLNNLLVWWKHDLIYELPTRHSYLLFSSIAKRLHL